MVVKSNISQASGFFSRSPNATRNQEASQHSGRPSSKKQAKGNPKLASIMRENKNPAK
jgi:hypothetical protein